MPPPATFLSASCWAAGTDAVIHTSSAAAPATTEALARRIALLLQAKVSPEITALCGAVVDVGRYSNPRGPVTCYVRRAPCTVRCHVLSATCEVPARGDHST